MKLVAMKATPASFALAVAAPHSFAFRSIDQTNKTVRVVRFPRPPHLTASGYGQIVRSGQSFEMRRTQDDTERETQG
jgi:hypothetical protein